MTKHSKQGKTFFATYDGRRTNGEHTAYAVHRAPSGHFSYIKYSYGTQVTGSQRTTIVGAATLLNLTEQELLELFNN